MSDRANIVLTQAELDAIVRIERKKYCNGLSRVLIDGISDMLGNVKIKTPSSLPPEIHQQFVDALAGAIGRFQAKLREFRDEKFPINESDQS